MKKLRGRGKLGEMAGSYLFLLLSTTAIAAGGPSSLPVVRIP